MERPLLVTDFLDRARKYYGDETGVVAATGERYTYDELGDRVDRFSALPQRRGVETGDRVAGGEQVEEAVGLQGEDQPRTLIESYHRVNSQKSVRVADTRTV